MIFLSAAILSGCREEYTLLEGLYGYTDAPARQFNTSDGLPNITDSKLVLKRRSQELLDVELEVVFDGLYHCRMSGEAYFVNWCYEIRKKTEDNIRDCVLRLIPENSKVTLWDVGTGCWTTYCDTLASFDGLAFSYRSMDHP